MPNAGHNLEQKGRDGKPDHSQAVNGLAAFGRHIIRDNPMPKLTWKHEDVEGKARLTVYSKPEPNAARLWLAEAPTRDFRKGTWTARPFDCKGGSVAAVVDPPARGFLTFYAELDYTIGDLPYHLSTQVRIVGE